MQVTHSLTLVVAAADLDAANAYFESLGWGSPVLSVPLSPNGQLPVTHYGAHAFQTAELVATLLAAKASDDPALDGLNPVFVFAEESAAAKFEAALQSPEILGALGTTLLLYYPPSEI